MSATKERPILFSGPMVRAIIEGRKTVTRRALKNQMLAGWGIADPAHPLATITSTHPKKGKFGLLIRREIYPDSGKFEHDVIPSPYGKPGDRLWVRETWARVGNTDPGYLTYRATYPSCLPPGLERIPADIRAAGYRWRPSIHMPRLASRILLEITAVRVERLRDISGEQALAEGIYSNPAANGMYTADGDFHTSRSAGPVEAFAHLWESINGACSWSDNPWVWVVEFKRVTP